MSDNTATGQSLQPTMSWSFDMLPKSLQRYGEYLDENWKTKVYDPSSSSYTPEMLSAHILRNMVSLMDQELRDDDLWDMFRSIFENWKLQDWKRTPGPVLKIFRNFLYENGVYTKIDNISIASKLDKLVINENFPEYPIEDIHSWLAKGKRFNSRFNPVKLQRPTPEYPTNINPKIS
ncbi:hypothetical protein OnM2_031047b [Erysiphe neolycopersici]|uniref:Uncharacterized protein n=1 Tax=Erysiphe neolycopersici TaxID=212602 RepID=A0A420HZ29_9PEZI|nr:hypothetical protein OnM2_031047b [Erysiphe neolycopersici]